MTSKRNLTTAALAVSTLVTCAAGSVALAEEVVVEVQGGPPFKFEQPNVTIKPGDTIKWVNKSGVLHTITADEPGGLKGTGDLQADGESAEHEEAFKGKPRTINYHCEIHPKMKGTITVAEAKAEAEPEAPEADAEPAAEAAAPPPRKPKKANKPVQPRRNNGGYGGGGYGGGGYGGY